LENPRFWNFLSLKASTGGSTQRSYKQDDVILPSTRLPSVAQTLKIESQNMEHQAQPFAFDTSAKQDAGAWLAELKTNTEKEPLAKLFNMFKRETTVRVLVCRSHLQESMILCSATSQCLSPPLS